MARAMLVFCVLLHFFNRCNQNHSTVCASRLTCVTPTPDLVSYRHQQNWKRVVHEAGDVQINTQMMSPMSNTQMMSLMSNRGQEGVAGPTKGLLLPSGPSFRAVPLKVPLLVRSRLRQLLWFSLRSLLSVQQMVSTDLVVALRLRLDSARRVGHSPACGDGSQCVEHSDVVLSKYYC